MGPKEAYEAIRRALEADPRKHIVASAYDEETFGNFVIAFEDEGQPKTVINDRGELTLCSDLSGTQGCVTLLPSLSEADEEAVARALHL